jgi:hypothetical protein
VRRKKGMEKTIKYVIVTPVGSHHGKFLNLFISAPEPLLSFN